MTSFRKLGELLLSSGLITNLQLSIALAAQQTSNRRLGEILVDRGFATEDQIASCLAEQYGYPRGNLATLRPQPSALCALKPDVALEHCVLPIRNDGDDFECVIADPLDVVTTDLVAQFVRKRLVLHIAPRGELTKAIRTAYGLDERAVSESALQGIVPPSRFGSVRARRKVGEGILFDAYDHQLERKVTLAAIKSGTPAERIQQRLVQSAARRPWKSVCAVHDWFEFEGHTWGVYERIEGESLAHILRTRGARSLTQATDLVAQLAEGVDVLNQAGGRCGLVCPDNVIVGPGYVILTPLANPGLEYTAPEIELGDSGTHLTDVFALGTLLWECVTGENPHVAAAVKANVKHDWAIPAIDQSTLPIALVDVLVHCLAKEPEDRYQSSILLANALRSYRWNAVSTDTVTTEVAPSRDREELLDVISAQAAFEEKPSFWKRLFGRRAA